MKTFLIGMMLCISGGCLDLLFGQSCTSKTAKVYFVNGIWTSEEDARKSLDEQLAAGLNARLGVRQSCVTYDLAYNRTTTKVGDLAESWAQLLGEQASRVFNFLAGIELAPDWFTQSALNVATLFDASAILLSDANSHAQKYASTISTEKLKVILVPHSQGNFYANEEYRILVNVLNQPPAAMKIVSVATPSPVVEGGGQHTTVYGDFIHCRVPYLNPVANITPCAVLLVLPLAPNIDNGPCGGLFQCHSFDVSYMTGIRSQPRILDLIAAEIPSDAAVGLVSYYQEEGTHHDSAGTSVGVSNGTLTATSSGKIGGAFDYSGNNSSGDPRVQAILPSVQSWTGGTISAWVKPVVYSSNNQLTVAQIREASTFGHLWLYITPGLRTAGFHVGTGLGSAVEARGATIINDNTWYHLVATWDKTTNTAKIYVNGNLDGTVNVPAWGQTTNEFYWGAGFNGFGTRGTIDEIGVWNRPLTQTEITNLYNNGNGRTYPF